MKSSSSSLSCDSSIARTAMDALHAKASLVQVGYTPVPINSEGYAQLLLGTKKIRRQTPLVNAGYAIRVWMISSSLERFLRNNQHAAGAGGGVNIVFLGCGLDVLGVWATQTSFATTPSPPIHLYELDCPDIIQMKQSMWMESNLFQPTTSDNKSDDATIIIRGTLAKRQHVDSTVTLVSCDLKDASSLQNIMDRSNINVHLPTIVISELVLAYLGGPSIIDPLMRYVSQHLCTSPRSLFLAYEPVGPTQLPSSILSVTTGYFYHYQQRFSSKLVRGNAHTNNDNNNNNNDTVVFFAPLGKDCHHVCQQMRQSWHQGPMDASLVGDALPYMLLQSSKLLTTPELLDEHAALALHLKSYAIVACGGASNSSSIQTFPQICPWSNPKRATHLLGLHYHPPPSTNNIPISTIQPQDEEQVQNLFQSAYTPWMEEYPSIKKLVKTALKTDLSSSSKPTSTKQQQQHYSTILCHYCNHGGSFFVATTQSSRQVLGCIGIKRRLDKGKTNNNNNNDDDDDDTTWLEINRLVIDPNARKKGIGTLLLDTAYTFAQQICWTPHIQILASTPDLLQPANSFYQASGFQRSKSEQMGKMIIHTYTKRIR